MKKRKDGRYLKVITIKGKRHYIYGETVREVTQQLLSLQQQVEKGRTVEELANEWWEQAQTYLALQSIKPYKPRYELFVDMLGTTPINELTPKDISTVLKSLVAKGYSHKTVSNQRTVINQICAYAIEQGDLTINPCAPVPIPKSAKPSVKVTSAGDTVERIIAANPDKWLFPFIALFTGLRKGEILALQWKDIDFERKLIKVTKSIAYNGDRPIVKAPKTEEGVRTVLLLEPLWNELLKHRGRAEDYIISDNGTKPLTNRRFITLMDHYREDLGISFTAHQLRHTFATLALGTTSTITVQGLMGHADASMTTGYADYRVSLAEAARNSINQAFSDRFFNEN